MIPHRRLCRFIVYLLLRPILLGSPLAVQVDYVLLFQKHFSLFRFDLSNLRESLGPAPPAFSRIKVLMDHS